MANQSSAVPQPGPTQNRLQRLGASIGMPILAVFTAFVVGGIVIWITSGSLNTVFLAYDGMFRGALIKNRALSESLVATVPYIFLGLGVAVGFKTGLFNIGVEGQFYLGAVTGAYIGQAFTFPLPAIIHLPLTLLAGALVGALWAGIPGYLKAKTGAHEVITTIMMNYIAMLLVEFLISGPLKDKVSSAVQTPPSAASAWIWTLASIPERLKDPLNALGVGLFIGVLAFFVGRWIIGQKQIRNRFDKPHQKTIVSLGIAVAIAVLAIVALPPLTQAWWPFKDQYDRLHVGLILGVCAAFFVWWLLWKTTLGFELRSVGANPNAARYSGMNITRNIVVAMMISGALAGIAGTIEVVGVSTCHCMPVLFSTGYGFDAIAVSLLAKNDPFGILAGAFLFGAMRNGADLMELNSGVSKYVIDVVKALALLFVAAPAIVRSIYFFRARRRTDETTPLEPRIRG
jgi:general nucleoside transport system permease protein